MLSNKRKIFGFLILILLLAVFTACPQVPDETTEDLEIKTPPALQHPDNEAEIGSNQVITLSWTSVANANSYIVTYGPGNTEQTVNGTSLSLSMEEEGYNVGDEIGWYVTAVGSVNRLSSDSRIFTIYDNEPPEITNLRLTNITTEFDGTPIFSPTNPVNFAATITDNVGVNEGSLIVDVIDGGGSSVGSPTGTLTGESLAGNFNAGTFTDGGNSFILAVTIADDRGNEAIETLTFMIDDTAPTAATIEEYITETLTEEISTDIDFIKRNFTFTGTAEDNVKVDTVEVVFMNSGTSTEVASYLADGQESWTCDITNLAEGTFDVYVRVTDVVGNSTDVQITDLDDVIVDNTPPDVLVLNQGRYTSHNTYANSWQIEDTDGNGLYGIYTGTIDVTTDYAIGNETNFSLPLAVGTNFNEIDLDICEPNSGVARVITVEVGIDGVYEVPIYIDTQAADCTIGSTYNAGIGENSTGIDTTDEDRYYINLLDFPKGTGNVIQDGQHTIQFRVTDEAGNITESTSYSFWTRLLNRPVLQDPYNGETGVLDVVFEWNQPTVEDDNANDQEPYVNAYYLDLSTVAPVRYDPSVFEESMLTKILRTDGTGDYYYRTDGTEVESDDDGDTGDVGYIEFDTDPDLGAGVYYWRVRAVIEDDNNEVIYELGSDYLPYDTSASDHRNYETNIHRLTVGTLYPPDLDGPWGEYFGTDEDIIISWDHAPNYDSYEIQMRAISPQGEDGVWSSVASGITSTNYTVNTTSAPISNNFAYYQLRIRTYENSSSPQYSGWAYGAFVYTPENFTYTSHLAEAANGIPIQVSDMEVSSSGVLYVADSTAHRIWKFADTGTIATSVDIGTTITGITLDTDDNMLYIAYGSNIVRYNSSLEKDDTYNITITGENIFDIDYYDGNIYALADSNKTLYEVSTTISGSVVELSDLTNLEDNSSGSPVPKTIYTLGGFGVDDDGFFVILHYDGTEGTIITRITDTVAWAQEAIITDTIANDAAPDSFYVNGYETLITKDGVTYRIGEDGYVLTPTDGYDEGDGTHTLINGVFNDDNVFVTASDGSNSQRLYNLEIYAGTIETGWGYNGDYTQIGQTWADNIIGLPGSIVARGDNTNDGYEIVDSGDFNIYAVDKGTDQIVKFNSSIRSGRFNNINGLALSPAISNSSGLYLTYSGDNSIYQLKDTLYPVTDGDFDSTGRLDNTIFDPDLLPANLLLNPKGMHLEERVVNNIISDYLYIADYGHDRIVSLLITQSGEQVTMAYDPVVNANINNPIDVAVFDRNNIMYVLTEDNTVHLLRRWDGDMNFQYRYSWTVPGTVRAIDTDQWGAVYVSTDHAVYKYGFDYWPFWTDAANDVKPIPNSDNGLLFGGSTAGITDNDFNRPLGISGGLTGWNNTTKNYTNGILYISDYLNRRIKNISE